MKTVRKILRYISYIGIIVGALMIAYGFIRNETAFQEIRRLLSESAFKIAGFGILLIIISLIIFIVSFSIGKSKKQEEPVEKQEIV